MLLLFPNGSLPTNRWRPVATFAVVVAGIATLNGFFVPGRLQSFPTVENPLGLGGSLGDVVDLTNAVGEGLLAPVLFTVSVSALVSVSAVPGERSECS